MRAGALQVEIAMSYEETMIQDQIVKVKEQLMELDGVQQEARRVSLFKVWGERWNANTLPDRLDEISEATKKGDLLTKVLKNLLSGFKGGKTGLDG